MIPIAEWPSRNLHSVLRRRRCLSVLRFRHAAVCSWLPWRELMAVRAHNPQSGSSCLECNLLPGVVRSQIPSLDLAIGS